MMFTMATVGLIAATAGLMVGYRVGRASRTVETIVEETHEWTNSQPNQ